MSRTYRTLPALYLIGSLRNPRVPQVARTLRKAGITVFDNWYSAGPEADDAWRDYERAQGHSYTQALKNHSAQNVFRFDQFHITRAHGAVLVLPAGRSGHIEAGFTAGQGKPVFMLLDTEGEPERLDVMTSFFTGVYASLDELRDEVCAFSWPRLPKVPDINIHDALWLAGLLEGDGSFCITGKQPGVWLQMTDYDVVARAASILSTRVWNRGRPTKKGKTVWGCGCSGLVAVEWMRILRPYLGSRRQKQILKTIQTWLSQRKQRREDVFWWERWFGLDQKYQGVL